MEKTLDVVKAFGKKYGFMILGLGLTMIQGMIERKENSAEIARAVENYMREHSQNNG